MTLRLNTVLLAVSLGVVGSPAFCDLSTSAQIDRDTWSVISQSVAEADIEAMASTYHPEAVLVNAGGTMPISQALEGWSKGMQDAALAGNSARVEFRFAQRQASETTAFETGIFKYVAVDRSGEENVSYISFESLLIKPGDRWLFMMERQLDASDQAGWDALDPDK